MIREVLRRRARVAELSGLEVVSNVTGEKYGLGFWTNDQGALSPSLPRDYFAASGGYQNVAVFRDQRVVVVQAPGLYWGPRDADRDDELLRRILAAAS